MILSGVYYLFNAVTCKVYVGSSRHCNKRIKGHIWLLRANRHTNCFLQRAWNIHPSHFLSGIIEQCASNELLSREDFYIKLFRARNMKYGYNLQQAKRDDSRSRWNDSVRAKMSKTRRAYFANNQNKVTEQVERLKAYWAVPAHKQVARDRASIIRRFRNTDTGEVLEGSIRSIARLNPSLDRAALTRVWNGKNKFHKGYVRS